MQPLLPVLSQHHSVHRFARDYSLRPISRDAVVQGRQRSQEVFERKAVAAGRARIDVAQQLVALDCEPVRYRHR